MSRGGRGGRGRGGAGSVFTPQLLGHLAYNDIIAQSKEGTGIFYPPTDVPQTEGPDEEESKIAKDQNDWSSEMKFTSYWIDPPAQLSTEIEKYADRFTVSTRSEDPITRLRKLNNNRNYDPELLPVSTYEAVFDKKVKTKKGKEKSKIAVDDVVRDDDDDDGNGKGSDEDQEEEEPEGEDQEEEYESENDYGEDHFDNGEDDGEGGGGDALGGGGDEEGGTYDY